MGRHWSVIVHYIAKAIQRPGATRDRDSLHQRSIAVVVPGIKALRQSLTQDNATPFCRCSPAPLPLELHCRVGLAACIDLLHNVPQWQSASATGGRILLSYAWVSKGEEQDTRMQAAALRAAGVERLFMECASGGCGGRPELHRLLDQLRPWDVVVVWKLDRQQQSAIVDMVHAGRQSQADAARLFRVHPAPVSRRIAVHRQQAAPAKPPADEASPGHLPKTQRLLSTHGTHGHPSGTQERTR